MLMSATAGDKPGSVAGWQSAGPAERRLISPRCSPRRSASDSNLITTTTRPHERASGPPRSGAAPQHRSRSTTALEVFPPVRHEHNASGQRRCRHDQKESAALQSAPSGTGHARPRDVPAVTNAGLAGRVTSLSPSPGTPLSLL